MTVINCTAVVNNLQFASVLSNTSQQPFEDTGKLYNEFLFGIVVPFTFDKNSFLAHSSIYIHNVTIFVTVFH